MSSLPGLQKNKIEYFVHRLYEEQGGRRLSKSAIMPKVQQAKFAPDVPVFFEELPESNYDEEGPIRALNEGISCRARVGAVGGLLE